MKRRTARTLESATRVVLGIAVFNLAVHGAGWSVWAGFGAMVVTIGGCALVAGLAEYAEHRRHLGDRS